jgi:hypothetical protein
MSSMPGFDAGPLIEALKSQVAQENTFKLKAERL